MIRNEAFLDLEASLIGEIRPQWVKVEKRISAGIITGVKAHDLSAVQDVVDSIDTSKLYKGRIRKINLLLKTGLLFGASRITGTAQGLHILDDPDVMEMVDIAEDQFITQIDQLHLPIKKNLMAFAGRMHDRLLWEEQNGDTYNTGTIKSENMDVEKAFVPINLSNVVGAQVASAGRNTVNVASSLQMSRMAGFGFLSEASARGITTYKINEQLDMRTCPVCRRMHGKEFKVPDGLNKLNRQIRVTDPEDLKAMAPWPKQDKESLAEMDKMGPEQLRSLGFDTPPFHPMCRGLLKDVHQEATQTMTVDRLFTGPDNTQQVNTKVAEVLDSAVGASVSQADREVIIAASTGVVEYALLPDSVKEFISGLEA